MVGAMLGILPTLGPKSKRITRPNYSPFANKLPNNSAHFSLGTNSPFVIGIGSWLLVGLSAVLFLLSLPLYCAHNWARLVFLGLAVAASILLLLCFACET